MDLVRVKGKQQAIAVYELVADPVYVGEEFVERCATFFVAFAAYRNQEWDKAIACYEALLESMPDDSLAQLYVHRCRLLADDPPGPDWDGAFEMLTK